MHGLIRWNLLGLFVMAMLCAMACQPPADEEAMAQLQQEIEDLKAGQNQLEASLKSTLDDLDSFKRKVETMLAARPGGGTAQTQQIESRLKALENQLNQIQTSSTGTRTGRSAAAGEVSPRVEATVVSEAATQSVNRRPRTGTAVSERSTKAAPSAQREQEERAPVGEYYLAREGDTFDSIARQYGITASEIRRANNNWPADRPLRPGQQYWVPARRPGSKN